MPIVGSKESIEFAGEAQHPDHAGPGAAAACSEDIIRYYAKCLASERPRDHARPSVDRRVGLCRRQQGAGGARNARPITSISTARCSATATSPRPALQRAGRLHLRRASTDYVRPENLRAAGMLREDFRNMTMADVERQAETPAVGHAAGGRASASSRWPSTPAPTRCRSASTAARMPQEMFIEQIRRFARDVLPALQAHRGDARAGGRGTAARRGQATGWRSGLTHCRRCGQSSWSGVLQRSFSRLPTSFSVAVASNPCRSSCNVSGGATSSSLSKSSRSDASLSCSAISRANRCFSKNGDRGGRSRRDVPARRLRTTGRADP